MPVPTAEMAMLRMSCSRAKRNAIVCGIDYRVDMLRGEVAADDHDAGRMDFSTSATR